MVSLLPAIFDNGPEKDRLLPHPEITRRMRDFFEIYLPADLQQIDAQIADQERVETAKRAARAALESPINTIADKQYYSYPAVVDESEPEIDMTDVAALLAKAYKTHDRLQEPETGDATKAS